MSNEKNIYLFFTFLIWSVVNYYFLYILSVTFGKPNCVPHFLML